MLIHEWTRYRDKPGRREEEQVEAEGARAEAEEAAEPTQMVAVETAEPQAATPETVGEPQAPMPETTAPSAPAPPARPATPPARLAASDFQSRRLQTLLARQQRLPLEVSEAKSRRTSRQPAESREEMIQRLLDPVLTIHEAAALLGVCTTSIRRYTNRGVLKCFRTPGNQRRFRLSDVLDFMEQQQETLE